MTKKIYIAATGQHKGKTTCTLGILAALKVKGFNAGYCKPVGQKHLMIKGKMTDKDAVLFEKILDFEVVPEIHSPVVIASGVTANFINSPEQFDFKNQIEYASNYLEKEHDIVVYEGTGHAGVGSVINLSNAQVAKMLKAKVIIIAEGGIGRTLDRLNLNLSLFREQKVSVIGVLINKVHQDKLEHVKNHLEPALKKMGIPLLGVLPFDRTLSFPLMATINKAIKGKNIFNSHQLDNQVEEILAGSLIEIDEFTYFQNILLIVNQTNFKEAIQKIKDRAKERKLSKSPLSGVIITGDGRQNSKDKKDTFKIPYLIENEIPLLTTTLEIYDTVVAISKIEVKINTSTPWKVERAIKMIQENINIDHIL